MALEDLIGRIDADLNSHFSRECVQYNLFAYRWINCFLMRELSLPLIVRLWDTYFAEEQDQGFKSFHVFICAAFLLQFSEQLKVWSDFFIIIVTRLHLFPTAIPIPIPIVVAIITICFGHDHLD